MISLPVLNAETATFECIFGRGCEGLCCQNGRPCTYDDERQRIQDNLDKFLPEMRPEAAQLAREEGFLSNRVKMGGKMLRVIGGWCIFFNKGCVLHKVGAQEGDAFKYKPYVCAVFPLNPHPTQSAYYVRQWGYEGEEWDVFCLNPKATRKKAVDTLQSEIGLVTAWLESQEAAGHNGSCNGTVTPTAPEPEKAVNGKKKPRSPLRKKRLASRVRKAKRRGG
jgi:hypothetical protein